MTDKEDKKMIVYIIFDPKEKIVGIYTNKNLMKSQLYIYRAKIHQDYFWEEWRVIV